MAPLLIGLRVNSEATLYPGGRIVSVTQADRIRTVVSHFPWIPSASLLDYSSADRFGKRRARTQPVPRARLE
ncbi:MAG: hypothetical protein WBR26_01490 [Candidatus Acidiferrum sp.]